jgi:hypothetical protein
MRGRVLPPTSLLLSLTLGAACASMPPTPIGELRREAMSRDAYERLLPQLERLRSGDDLAVLGRMRRVEWLDRGGRDTAMVVIPAWIASMSGGAAGGLSLLGQRVGRAADRLHGSHVFGYVAGERLVPRYQVATRARLIDRDEYERLRQESLPGIGMLASAPRPSYFRDLEVAGTRTLAFPEPPRDGDPGEDALVEDGLAAFYSEERFRSVEPLLRDLPAGTDLFGMLLALDARFVTSDYGESHSLLAPGFLNYRSVRTRSIATSDGLYKLRPFGYVEGGREVVRWIAIFKNDRLEEIVPHTGLDDWSGYIR